MDKARGKPRALCFPKAETRIPAVEQPMKTLVAKKTDTALAHRLAAMGGAIPSGFPALDTALDGGFPRGAVSALLGDPCLTMPTLRAALAAQLREEDAGFSAWVGPGFRSWPFKCIGGDSSRVLLVENVRGIARLLSLVRLDLMVVVAESLDLLPQIEANARASGTAVVVACRDTAGPAREWDSCALVCLLDGSVERVDATVATHRYSLGASPSATYDASEPTTDG